MKKPVRGLSLPVGKLGLLSLFAAAVVLLGTQIARAETRTASLNVTATVAASATVSVGGSLAFGDYSTASGNLASVIVTVTATNGLIYDLYVPEGREMTSGANTIPYDLYRDATHLGLLGTNSNNGWERTGTGAMEDITVYGWIAPGLNPPVGTYSQTVTITVEY